MVFHVWASFDEKNAQNEKIPSILLGLFRILSSGITPVVPFSFLLIVLSLLFYVQ